MGIPRVLAGGGSSSAAAVAATASSSVASVCRDFTLSKMKEATNNLDESLKLGRGGFGFVYKGTIFDSDTNDPFYVAIKLGESYNDESIKQYLAEVDLLSELSHGNVASLIGNCNDEENKKLILVYEYMYNGTLYDCLHEPKGRPPLTWVRRLKILLGAARGLNYLHAGGIVHRDMKSANLLLDKFFGAKICDFGLAKTGTPEWTSDNAKGTDGYADPEYLATKIPTQKSDVFGFGVTMFETLCGKRVIDVTSEDPDERQLARKAPKFFREGKLHEIADSNIKETITFKCLEKFAKLASQCVDTDPNKRPTMAKVVSHLESILILQEKTNKLSSTKSASNSVIPYWKKEKVSSLESYLKAVGGEFRTLHQLDFETIDVATENFTEANRILKSNLGTMYKGKLQNGEDIAIVSGHFASQTLDEVYENQLSILVKLEHENVFQLHGYCVKETMVYLLFKCAPYASLESLIFDPNRPLDWEKRYKILLGVAHAILYLHVHAPVQVIDVAVTPCKIVLDKNWNPKLSGYCFVASRVPDKSGHIEPSKDRWVRESLEQSYLSTDSTRSTKSDVFSYGVLILETITGRRRKDPSTELLEDYVGNNLMGRTLPETIVTKSVGDLSVIERYLMVGVLCTQKDAAGRPTMETVVEMLLGNPTVSDGLFPKVQALMREKWRVRVGDIKRVQARNK